MLDAIRAGQAEEADRLMREHITVQGSHITSLITRLPPEYFPDTPKSPVGGRAAALGQPDLSGRRARLRIGLGKRAPLPSEGLVP